MGNDPERSHSVFALLHLCVPLHLSSGLLQVPSGVSSWAALPVQYRHGKTRCPTGDDVREELCGPLSVRCERAEIRLGPLLQLHQRVLRHRPVQRSRVHCCPQLGASRSLPAACTLSPAGLNTRGG